jgi:hypothetical protein
LNQLYREIFVQFHHFKKSGLQALVLAGLALAGAQAQAANLIQNGGFEADLTPSYSPANWQVFEDSTFGSVLATSGTSAPASGWDTVGAASGNNYGIIDANWAGGYALAQSFSTGQVASATLSFSMFVNDQRSSQAPIIDSTGLDYTTGGDYRDNQHVRVDLLSAGADPLHTGSSVLRSFYLGGANGPTTNNNYSNYSFDVGADLAAGGNYVLRFAAVTNVAQMQIGIDNVSLNVTPVPEPESYAMLLAGLGLLGGVAARRRKNAA